MLKKLLAVVVVTVALVALSAGGLAAAPLDAPLAENTVMGTLGAGLEANHYQTATEESLLDTQALMDGVNEGVAYGFTFANVFLPLVVIMVGFAVAGGVLGLLMKIGPQIARMIRSAF